MLSIYMSTFYVLLKIFLLLEKLNFHQMRIF